VPQALGDLRHNQYWGPSRKKPLTPSNSFAFSILKAILGDLQIRIKPSEPRQL
jgi:hypothetical protein